MEHKNADFEAKKDSADDVVVKLVDGENVFVVREDEGLVISPKQLKRLSNALASGHLNFLLGSGFSVPLIPVLSKREDWFTASLKEYGQSSSVLQLLQAEYYVNVLIAAASAEPGDGQLAFIDAVKKILKNRGNTSIPRRANIFTTNYDMLIEKSCEMVGIPYNDGFSGRFAPVFSTESFSRVLCEQSFAHEYLTQIPTVSVMKMHGSLSWMQDGTSIRFRDSVALDDRKALLADKELSSVLAELKEMVVSECDEAGVSKLREMADRLAPSSLDTLNSFSAWYSSLCIVSPTKHKFEQTILELGYYELMRLYSNEMDRSNALLISLGFSFRDEHILEITKRALGNPMLLLIVFCHRSDDLKELKKKFNGVDNVWFVVGETEEIKIDARLAAKFLSGVVQSE